MSATGSQSYLALIKQVAATPRVIPANPVLQKVNFSSNDLGVKIPTKVSEHIRSDRMTTDITRTGFNVAGGYDFEFQFENSLLDDVLAGFMWSEWAAGGSLGVGGKIIKNGSVYQPFFIERGHVDASQYFQFIGMGCDKFTLNLPDADIVTGSYQFVGMNAVLQQAITTGATYTEATQNPIFSTSHNIPEIAIDGVAVTSCIVKDLTMTLDNKLTAKTGIGVLGACETNAHRLSITGKLTMYFEDETMYDRFAAGEAFSLSWTFTDTDANSYKFTLPAVKISDETIPVGGDNDIMDNVTYTAIRDSVSECMIQIEKTA